KHRVGPGPYGKTIEVALNIIRKLIHGPVTSRRVLLDSLQNDVVKVAAQLVAGIPDPFELRFTRALRLFFADSALDLQHGTTGYARRANAGQQFVEDQPQSINVGSCGDRMIENLFRRCVLGRKNRFAGNASVLRAGNIRQKELGDAEVEELDEPAWCDENVS